MDSKFLLYGSNEKYTSSLINVIDNDKHEYLILRRKQFEQKDYVKSLYDDKTIDYTKHNHNTNQLYLQTSSSMSFFKHYH